MAASSLKEVWDYNIATFRSQPLSEISGSLGDLGTFLPILIALSSEHQIDLATSLILTGIYNIITGMLFGIPLPVQPMKAIAAVALLKHLSASEVAVAGLFVSACILVLSVTGLLQWITDITPIPIVKGIQLGAGLSLVIAAGTKATSSLNWLGPHWADNYIWLVFVFTALMVTTSLYPRLPFALLVLLVGLAFSVVRILTSNHHQLPTPTLWHPYLYLPELSAIRTGIFSAGIGQLPLTTLNSVIAVVHLSSTLLPDRPAPSATAIGISVASMNLIGCWFGAMPACHGSGGLAAQYRFGARSGASVIILGTVKVILGLIFGNSLSDLLQRFPVSFLTVMIIAAGLELASVGESLNTEKAKDLQPSTKTSDAGHVPSQDLTSNRQVRNLTNEEQKQRWAVMLVTAGVLVAFKNDGVGFVAGLLCHASLKLGARIEYNRDAHKAQADANEHQPLLS